jgi:polar amino acid transport system substrate-binding protein
MSRMILVTLFALATVLATPVPADARSLDDIIKSGVLKISVHPNLPPLSSINTNQEWEGFDIDIGKLLADKLGVKAEFVGTETPSRVPNIVSGIVDISLGGLTRNSRRMKVIDFTVPLHTENMAVLLTDKVKGVTDWKDLNREDITLVECRGCTPAKFVEDNLPNAKMILVEGAADMVRTVAQGRADGLVANLDFYPVLLRNHPTVNWVILPDIIKTAYDAIGLEKGNAGLQNWLNQALWEIQDPGIHDQLWEKHYGMPPIVKVVAQPYF